MGRLFSCGFENQSVVDGVEGVSAGTLAISTTTKRSGNAALRVNPTAGFGYKLFNFSPALLGGSSGTGPLYVRFAIRLAAAPTITTDNPGAPWQNFSGSSTHPNQCAIAVLGNTDISSLALIQAAVTIDAARGLHLFASDGVHLTDPLLGGTVLTLALDTWYVIQLGYGIDGNATIEMLVDGVLVSQAGGNETGATGALMLLTGAFIDHFFSTQFTTPTSGTIDIFFDDIAVNHYDGTGFEDSYPPLAGKIVHARPNAAGDSNLWLHDSGAAGDSNNYAECSEVPPDDATSYVKRISSGVNIIDDYNVEDSATIGIGPTDSISVVQVGGRVGALSTTVANRTARYRLKGAASGAVITAPTAPAVENWNVNGWTTHRSQPYKSYPLTSYLNPDTGLPWTPTGASSIDNAQIGIVNASSSSVEIRCSTLWALIEYIPNPTLAGGCSDAFLCRVDGNSFSSPHLGTSARRALKMGLVAWRETA